MYHNDIIFKMLDRLGTVLNHYQENKPLWGVENNNNTDPYFSGKMAKAISLILVINQEKMTEEARLHYYALLNQMTTLPCEGWGKYYFLQAIRHLNEHQMLEHALPAERIAFLRNHLVWDNIVQKESYQLPDGQPMNLYGVAFSIARLRYLLNWEDESASEQILAHLLQHYNDSLGNGFIDETRGEGRFDRGGILLAAEMSQYQLDSHMPLSPSLRRFLGKSVQLVLQHINPQGIGFSWGRSVGAYGDTAFMMILATAQRAGLLSAQESQVAQAFTQCATARFDDFWFDDAHHSVNLWFNGRKPDSYRAANRILGENITLLNQLIYIHQAWKPIAETLAPLGDGNQALNQYCLTQPKVQYTAFQTTDFVRGIYSVRDRLRLFTLPLINGGDPWHSTTPYFPLPFSDGLFSGVAEGALPAWIPQLYCDDGSVLMPLVYFGSAEHKVTADGCIITLTCSGLDFVGQHTDAGVIRFPYPDHDKRYGCVTRYIFKTGQITREDVFTLPDHERGAVNLFTPTMAVANRQKQFSHQFALQYAHPLYRELTLSGYQTYKIHHDADNPQWHTPTGAWQEAITASAPLTPGIRSKAVQWSLKYHQ